MSLTLTNLVAKVQENSTPILVKAIYESKLMDTQGILKLNGVQGSSVKIPNISSTLYAQAANCGFTSSGSTTIDQKQISLCELQWKESICAKDLLDYFTAAYTNNKTNETDITAAFAADFIAEKVQKIQKDFSQLMIGGVDGTTTGTTTMGSSYSQCSSSLLKDAKDNKATLGWTGTTTAITASNAITVIQSYTSHIPEAILDANDLYLFVSPGEYQAIKNALVTANLYNYALAEQNGVIEWPYQNLKIKAEVGLTNKNHIITTASNIAIASRIADEQLSPMLYPDPITNYLYFSAGVAAGMRLIFPELALVTFSA